MFRKRSEKKSKIRTDDRDGIFIDLWLMPSPNLHMTALEITHSLTAPEIDALVDQLLPHAQPIADYPASHRARLVKPCVSFDAQALALSFLPAAGEPRSESGDGKHGDGDGYTYHHLRRDIFAMASRTDVTVASRYVIPSAHLTVGRFVTKKDFEGPDGRVEKEKMRAFVDAIAEVNAWLEREYWPKGDGTAGKEGGEWVVGEEKGLEFRKGALWYGAGGETVLLGKGF
jgi:hypothetical protein